MRADPNVFLTIRQLYNIQKQMSSVYQHYFINIIFTTQFDLQLKSILISLKIIFQN